MTIVENIMQRAGELGFERVAIVPAAALPHAEQYQHWLTEGRHAEMGYMDNHHELRVDPTRLEEGTRSVVVLLKNYNQQDDLLPGGLRIARYAQGTDYHEYLWTQMRELAAFIHAETGADVATRPAVDTAPLLERDLAALAGLGWVGKNALLISPEIGSFTFIAEILVDLDLEATHTRVPDRCGTCSRCMDACPTGAIISPYIIDARRCISYLTIELRGPIPRELRPLVGDYLFGCDICQVVCPWNRKAPVSADPVFEARGAYLELTPLELLEFDHARYVETFRKSAMKRAKLGGLKRNAAVVLGNTAGTEAVPVLAARLVTEVDSLVRGHIAWALGQIAARFTDAADAVEALRAALANENDPYVLEEIRHALGPAASKAPAGRGEGPLFEN